MTSSSLRPSFAALLALVLIFGASARPGTQKGYDTSRLDRRSKPCQDFYRFANGGWLDTTKIPPGHSRWASSDVLFENNRASLRRILEAAAADSSAEAGSSTRLIGDFYSSCMDESHIEAAGADPIADDLALIARVSDLREMSSAVAHLHAAGVSALFLFGSWPDSKDASRVIAYAGQGGLSLPNRDYYTKADEKSKLLRGEFLGHVARVLELLGDPPGRAAEGARAVMRIESELASASMTPVEERDPEATYNKMTAARLARLAPAFSWDEYFAALGVSKGAAINVAQPKFFTSMQRMLRSVPLADWKVYLRWHLINNASPHLSKKFADENFAFFGRTLEGKEEQLPRWKRCVASTDTALGEALGRVYIESEFSPESKVRMQEMIRNLLAAFRQRIARLTWMSEETRRQAYAKLDAFKYEKIGYPEKWRDYSGLKVERGAHFANVRRATLFEVRRQLRKIGSPTDRSEWLLTTPEVNAYHHPHNVEIAFPAGILQPPFFDPEADDALNYGSIGGVIGHEITHGFDDFGSQFDASGNLRRWWKAGDRRKFEQRAECIIKQFDGYKAVDGTPMIGKLVVGESIADLGGLQVAFDAYRKSLEGKPRPPDIEGFTPEQRFFLGWARVWASLFTPEYERLLAKTNEHPIDYYRAIGPLSNMPEFAAAWGCKEGDPMVRPARDRCEVW